jgi:hypothetical protein
MPDPKESGRSDPKESGRSDPKESGRSDPKESGRGVRESVFGGGAGWVVVAFISPVGINVPDLAIGMLGGRSVTDGTGPSTPLADAAALAVDRARKQAKLQEEQRIQAEKYRAQQKTGKTGRRM